MGGKSSDPGKAQRAELQKQRELLAGLSEPELEEYFLQNPELVGLMEAEQLGPSAMGEIQLDPQLRDKQIQALEGLQKYADQGMTDQDKYQMEELLGQAGAQEKSQRASIESEMARRGTGDSGASLMSKLQGVQGGANQARKQAMQMGAQGQQSKMNALQQLGQVGSQMENAAWNRKASQATAADNIAKANAMNRQQIAGQNLASRQNIENQRANIANQQAQVRNQIEQQKFNNAYSKAGGQGAVTNAMASTYGGPQKPGAMQSALGGAATGASVGGSVGGPVGAGYGAAIGGGVGLLSSMEDGGIAGNYADGGMVSKVQEQEDKAHDKFKKDYMKRVREELSPMERAKQEVTGQISAKNGGLAQKQAHDEVTGQIHAKDGFKLNKSEFAPISYMDKIDSTLVQPEMLGATPVEADPTAAAVENTQLAPQEDLLPKEESGMSGAGIAQGLGALSKIMAAPKRERVKIPKYSQPKIDNVLGKLNIPQFEDGGLPSAEALKAMIDSGEAVEVTGEFADGGMPMYASDGMGDIVDSGMGSYADDRVDAKINDGEAILNVPQQQRFMDLVRGKIGPEELGDEDIVEGVPESYRDELHEKIEGGDSGESDKIKGLKRLLEALGE